MSKTPFRGLPPPAGLKFSHQSHPSDQPTMDRSQRSKSVGLFPDLPLHCHRLDKSMCSWLLAKAEEDKRRQEEEKTRQEALRLEQLKIEQDMLRVSLQGGIPPFLIPMFFSGIGRGNMPNPHTESGHSPTSQAHNLQQQHDPTPHRVSSPCFSRQSTKTTVPKSHQMPQRQELRHSKTPHFMRSSARDIQAESPIHFYHWQPPAVQIERSSSHNSVISSEHESSPKRRRTQQQYASSSLTEHGPSILNPTLNMPQNQSRKKINHSARDLDNYGDPAASSTSHKEPTGLQPQSASPYSVSTLLNNLEPSKENQKSPPCHNHQKLR